MKRYAVLIDYYTEGLHYVTVPEEYPKRGQRIAEVETLGEALVLAADHAHGNGWEIVERVNVRTTPGSKAAQLGLA